MWGSNHNLACHTHSLSYEGRPTGRHSNQAEAAAAAAWDGAAARGGAALVQAAAEGSCNGSSDGCNGSVVVGGCVLLVSELPKRHQRPNPSLPTAGPTNRTSLPRRSRW